MFSGEAFSKHCKMTFQITVLNFFKKKYIYIRTYQKMLQTLRPCLEIENHLKNKSIKRNTPQIKFWQVPAIFQLFMSKL